MPKFIGLEAVLVIHHEQINLFGGLHGVRDKNLLESAMGQAELTYTYTNDLYETAAQYCVSLAKNHAFLDGNKRIAADCMLTFLVVNHIEPTMTSEQLFEWTMQVAIGEIERHDLAQLLRTHSKPKI
jgi:death-on-curing protein